MRYDRAGDAGAVDMWAFLAAERIKGANNRIRKFRMSDVDSGIDNGDGDVGAMGQRMRLGQSKFQKRILGGITLGHCRRLGVRGLPSPPTCGQRCGTGRWWRL